jgi:hypothetical protein
VQTLLNASDCVANRLFFHLKSPIRWRMLIDIPEKCTQVDRRHPPANGTFYAAA